MKTVGQILLSSTLPEDMRHYADQPLDKGRNKKLFKDLAEKHPEEYARVLHDLTQLSQRASYFQGGETSPGLDDLRVPSKLKGTLRDMREHVDSIVQKDIPAEEKKKKIVDYVRERSDKVRNTVIEEGAKEGNMFAISAAKGFRGNPVQVTQLLVGDLLNTNNQNEPVPVAGLHGYGEGITPEEQMAGAYGALKGFANVQFLTAKTGYLSKQLSQAAADVKVTGEDCGAEDVGYPIKADDPEAIGRVLAEPAGNFKAGTILDEDKLSSLKNSNIVIRSPHTCQQRYGVCRLCAGQDAKGQLPSVGDYVGLKAADSLSEPITQTFALGSKHLGGTVGSKRTALPPYEDVNQLFQASESFKGAVISPVEGEVRSVSDAPQGGKTIKVGNEEIHVPPDMEITINKGDKLEAGDSLTEGALNPKDLVKYKGLGEARRLFADQLNETFRRHGEKASRYNTDAVARGYLTHVKITDPDGVAGYSPGKIVNYAEVQDRYEPREGSVEENPSKAIGKYLEKPTLHYTVGTKVTPRVASTIEKYKRGDIVVNQKEPSFEPYVRSPVMTSGLSEDWKERMGGFNIRKSFLDAARTGSTSPRNSKGYIPELMNPVKLHSRLNKPKNQAAAKDFDSLLNAG